jgi:hypothetical protein
LLFFKIYAAKLTIDTAFISIWVVSAVFLKRVVAGGVCSHGCLGV